MKSDKKKNDKKSNQNIYIILGALVVLGLIIGGYWYFTKEVDYKTVPVGNAKSPTEAYKMLFAAVKSKDVEKIKAMMSENTKAFAEFVAAQQKKSVDEVFANGFTATTFAEKLPQMRDERIKDGFGAVEVINPQKIWEDLPFLYESLITVESAGNNREAVLAIVKGDMKIPEDKAEEFLNALPQTIGGYTNVQAENIRQKLAEAGASVQVKNVGWKLAVGDAFKGNWERPGPGQAAREQEAANMANNNMIPMFPANNANNANVQIITPKNSGIVNKNVPKSVNPANVNR